MILALILLMGFPFQGPEPYLIEGGRSGGWRKYQLNVLRGYDVLDRVPKTDAEWYQTDYGSDLGYPAGYVRSSGKLTYLSKSGETRGVTYFTAPGEEIFRRYVAAQVAKRGPNATASGPELQKTIPSSVQEIQIPVTGGSGGPTTAAGRLRMPELHTKYSNNTIWVAYDREALGFSQQRVRRFTKLISGSFWYIKYSPGAIPVEHRLATLKQVEKITSISFQQRDQEDASRYTARRTIGEEYLDLYRSSLLEIDEVTSWTKEPTRTRPWRAQVRLSAIPKTSLASLIRGLPSRQRIDLEELDSSNLSVFVNLTIPPQLRPSLQTILVNSPLKNASVSSAIQGQIEGGHLVLGTHILETEDGSQLVSGALQLDLPDDGLQAIQSVLPGKLNGNQFVADIPLTSVKGVDFGKQTLVISPSDKETRFVFGPIDQQQAVNVLDNAVLKRSKRRTETIVRIEGDLTSWIFQEEKDITQRLLLNLFSVYRQIRYDRARSRFMNQFKKRGQPGSRAPKYPPLPPPVTLDDISWKEGDWSFRFSLKVVGETLIADAEVGKELFDHVLLRHRLTR